MKVALGICGSIASYRSPDLVKALVAKGHGVRCVLTKSAVEFVTPKVLETFSQFPVSHYDSFSPEHFATDHIEMARWADCFLVYGASANTLARLAAGFADDFLSLQLLAFQGPVYIAPAMNPAMWMHPAVQANVDTLKKRGLHFVGPISGVVACGEEGVGHVADIADIVLAIESAATNNAALLKNRTVLISAGPMRAAIDDVRFLQNRSSGLMGVELALAAHEFGAKVHLLLGPVEDSLRSRIPAAVAVTSYETVTDYERALEKLFSQNEIFISTAAVLDFQTEKHQGKWSRKDIEKMASLSLPVKPVSDFVAELSKAKKKEQKIVAFSLESGSLSEQKERALQKMKNKQSNFMVLNSAQTAPESDQNELFLIGPAGEWQHFPRSSKAQLARKLWHSLIEQNV